MSPLKVLVRCGLCLDTSRCWVCEGSGTVDVHGAPCRRCEGSGACRHAGAGIPAQRTGSDDA